MSIHQSAVHLLGQLKVVVDQMSGEQFSTPLPILSNASVGQHVRHMLEFFLCLMEASKDSVVNYDLRNRDQYLEQDPKLANGIISSIHSYLMAEKTDFPLNMEANYEDSDEVVRIHTSYLRELAYNIEHAIHHMALIKVGVRSNYPELHLPEDFGVASSTIRYQKSQNA